MPSDETVVQMQHPIAAACNNPHDTLFYPISPISSCVSMKSIGGETMGVSCMCDITVRDDNGPALGVVLSCSWHALRPRESSCCPWGSGKACSNSPSLSRVVHWKLLEMRISAVMTLLPSREVYRHLDSSLDLSLRRYSTVLRIAQAPREANRLEQSM